MNPAVTTILAALGMVAAMVFSAAVVYGVNAFQKWSGIQLTNQQRQIIADAADAIAGALKLLLAQGQIQASELKHDNPKVVNTTNAHLTPELARALDHTLTHVDDLSRAALSELGHDKEALAIVTSQRRVPPTK